MLLIERQEEYDEEALIAKGLNVIKHHLWYVNPELATLALYSDKLTCDVRATFVIYMTP